VYERYAVITVNPQNGVISVLVSASLDEETGTKIERWLNDTSIYSSLVENITRCFVDAYRYYGVEVNAVTSIEHGFATNTTYAVTISTEIMLVPKTLEGIYITLLPLSKLDFTRVTNYTYYGLDVFDNTPSLEKFYTYYGNITRFVHGNIVVSVLGRTKAIGDILLTTYPKAEKVTKATEEKKFELPVLVLAIIGIALVVAVSLVAVKMYYSKVVERRKPIYVTTYRLDGVSVSCGE